MSTQKTLELLAQANANLVELAKELSDTNRIIAEAVANLGNSDNDKPADKPEAKKAPAKKPAAKKDEPKGPTLDDIKDAVGDFLETDDEDEKDARKAQVKKLTAKYDVERAGELADSPDGAAFIDELKKLGAGEQEEKEEPKKKAAPRKSRAKPKGPSVDEIRKQVGDFIGVDDEDERASRSKFVKKTCTDFGADKAGELAGTKEGQEFLDAVAAEAEKRAEAADDEGGDDDLV